MKKISCLFIALWILLSGCSQKSKGSFKINENGNLIDNSGIEYTRLANEGHLYYLGEIEFIGNVRGERKTSQQLGSPYQTGMFAIKSNAGDNILIRYEPDNEWFSIYRKTSLPAFVFSVDNCVRLEFVSGIGNIEKDIIHITCKGGIFDKSEIAEFLSDVRSQESPSEAGLYDLIKNSDGMLENCYTYGVIYGFFEEEPNLVIRMSITSYNDLAYSIAIGADEYVLSTSWFQKLVTANCVP